jgi:hypothetical protein
MKTTIGVLLLFFPLLCGPPFVQGAEQGEGIMFLRLKLEVEGVRLLECSVRPGVLKDSRNPGQTLLYQLVSAEGTILHRGSFSDPRRQRIEVPPAHAGSARHPSVKAASAEVSLRVPFYPAAARVDFFERTAEPDAKPQEGRLPENKPPGKPLGTVQIPAAGGTQP